MTKVTFLQIHDYTIYDFKINGTILFSAWSFKHCIHNTWIILCIVNCIQLLSKKIIYRLKCWWFTQIGHIMFMKQKQASHRAKDRAQYQQGEVEKVKTILHCPMRSKVSFVDKLFISQLKTNLWFTPVYVFSTLSVVLNFNIIQNGTLSPKYGQWMTLLSGNP